MPINEDLPDIKLPTSLDTAKEVRTKFKEQLTNIKVHLIDGPTEEQLLKYIAEFSGATWEDKPRDDYTRAERKAALKDLFDGNLLPTAYETIRLTFRIEGMDIIDTTHLIRHRTLGFSAQCTADRVLSHDDAVVKPSIMKNEKFFGRYCAITAAAKELYADMIASGEVSILDARTILTRNLETFYYVTGNLKDCMTFVQTRLDEQIQTMSDNVIALLMWKRIVERFPQLVDKIKIGGRDEWYIKTAASGRSSNIYMPKPENDVFDYKPSWFLYQKRRDDFPGSEVYREIKESVVKYLDMIKRSRA